MADGKRQYNSVLRENQARETRRRIVRSAGELFAEQGWSATTIDAIAGRAGVSRKTVFGAVGGKAVLVKLALDWAIVGDDEPVALEERAAIRAMQQLEDPAVLLDRFAAHSVGVVQRTAGIYLALRSAADADPEAAAVWEKVEQERVTGMSHLAAHLERIGGLRPGLSRRRATDLLYFSIDPGNYEILVLRRGWSAAAYREWMARALRAHLLPS